jgi:membrane associated rhomboid family serine protease
MAYRGSYQFGFGLTPWVQRLLIANFAVFIVVNLAMPQLLLWLAFTPRLVLVQPWTLATYMFAHGSFWHLFFNMIALFFFGPALEQRWGSTEFIKFYVFCGLGGAAFSFLFAFYNPVIGASAAVYGIMLAFAMNWPNMPIYIWGILPVPAKYLVGVLVVITLWSAVAGPGGPVAHFAHLGGFIFALIYMKFITGAGGPFSGLRQRLARRRLSVVHDREQPPSPPPTTRRTERRQADPRLLDEIDRLLDKISTEGMSSLTPEERRLLDEVSRKYRQN